MTIFRIKWKGNDICMPECVNLSRELSQVDLYLNCTDLISSRYGDLLHKMSGKWINMSLKCRLSKCPSIPIMLCSVCVRIGSQDYVLVLLPRFLRDSQAYVFQKYEWKLCIFYNPIPIRSVCRKSICQWWTSRKDERTRLCEVGPCLCSRYSNMRH